MQKEDIKAGVIYEGPRRRGHRVSRRVTAIEPRPGFATEVRFIERMLGEEAPERSVTLKSFTAWAVRRLEDA